MGNKSCGKINHKITKVDGITFHSKMESEFYIVLRDKKLNGEIRDFKMQVPFILQKAFVIVDGQVYEEKTKEYNKARKLKVKNNPAITYITDFVVTDNDGVEFVIDTKGISTADFEIKKKWFNYLYPEYNGLKVICKYKGKWVDFYFAKKEKNKVKKANKALKAKGKA